MSLWLLICCDCLKNAIPQRVFPQRIFTSVRIQLFAARGVSVKIIEKKLRKGFVKVVPDSQDDLWHLYNIVYKNDEAYAYSSRAIKTDTEYSRPKSAERVSALMGVRVEA